MMNDLISRQAAIDEANAWLLDCLKVQKQNRSCGLIRRLEDLPSAQPTYTDEEIQKMQDLESAQIEKAYQLGYEEGKKDAQPERKTGKWIERWHENKHVIGDMACSVCGAQMLLTYPRFCPYCGAEMRGEQ